IERGLARGRHIGWSQDRPAAAPELLESATRGVEKLSPVDRVRVMRTLVGVMRDRGDLRRAVQLSRRWGRLVPHDLTARLTLFDLAAEAGADTTRPQAP